MTTPKKPQDRKPSVKKPAPTPSEIADAQIARDDLRKELLSDLPALRPAHRFRIMQRYAFQDLALEAMKSGVFDDSGDDDGEMSFDTSKVEDIERLQKLHAFVASIDAWAHTIAEDPEAYEEWSEGKTEEHFMALFVTYREALGESSSSVS